MGHFRIGGGRERGNVLPILAPRQRADLCGGGAGTATADRPLGKSQGDRRYSAVTGSIWIPSHDPRTPRSREMRRQRASPRQWHFHKQMDRGDNISIIIIVFYSLFFIFFNNKKKKIEKEEWTVIATGIRPVNIAFVSACAAKRGAQSPYRPSSAPVFCGQRHAPLRLFSLSLSLPHHGPGATAYRRDGRPSCHRLFVFCFFLII